MTLTKHSIDTLQMLIESNQVSILRSKILEDTNSLTQAVFQIEYFFIFLILVSQNGMFIIVAR